MKEVTVPVWHLDPSTGERASSACTFTIHEALADDMTAIFTAIYEDPEQFPIKNIGGYRWTDAAKGEHNCGTAVDINWEENYQIYDSGQVGARFSLAARRGSLFHSRRRQRGAYFCPIRL